MTNINQVVHVDYAQYNTCFFSSYEIVSFTFLSLVANYDMILLCPVAVDGPDFAFSYSKKCKLYS